MADTPQKPMPPKPKEQPVVIPTATLTPKQRPATTKPITPQISDPAITKQPQPGLTPAHMAPGFMERQRYQYQ